MGSLPSLAAFVLLVATCAFVGRSLALLFRMRPVTIEFSLLFGFLVLHVWMLWTTQFGIEWSSVGLFAPLVGVASLAYVRSPSADRSGSRLRQAREMWRAEVFTDLILIAILAVFFYWSRALKLVHSDFFYHWGGKGERFFLNQGVDWGFLARPENGILHPDYPLLLPDLYAALATLGGSFDQDVQQLWGAVFLAALALACRRLFRGCEGSVWARNAAILIVVAVTASFALAYYQSGGPDLPFAVLFLMGTVELLAFGASDRRSWPAALRIGVYAALLAGCKLEGIFAGAALAGLVATKIFLRGFRTADGWRAIFRSLFVLSVPPLLAVLPWWLMVSRYGLFQSESNSAGIRLEILGSTLRTMFGVLQLPAWQGLCFVVVLVPALFLVARLRWAAALIALQLTFYGYAYLTSPHDPVFFVKSNFPRLLYHVVPALFLLLLVWLVPRTVSVEGDANATVVPKA